MNATLINELTTTYGIEDHGDFATVELDMTGTPAEVERFAKDFFCTVELVDHAGPAAGWPVYKFEGVFPSVVRLVKAYDE